MNNKACSARPAIIVIPLTTEDVAVAVTFAVRHGFELSVRSGGHGYTCSQLKEGGVQIDMRSMSGIQLVKTDKSTTGLAAVLGTGATWGQVQRVISPTTYSYPHGQCPTVGVGGYLLGGGINWLGTYNKYGYGAEQVLRIRMVTANGTILDLEPGTTVIHPKYAHEAKVYFSNSYDDDLFFAMRGAGSSFGIATEFLYTIFPTPETLPAFILVWVEDMKDLWSIQEAAYRTNRYSIALNNEFAGTFWESFLARVAYKFLPTLLTSIKTVHRSGATPVFLTVTDISPRAGTTTDAGLAVSYLDSQGVDLLFRFEPLVRIIDKLARKLYRTVIEEQEATPPSETHLVGVHLGGMANSRALEEVYFDNPFFGVRRDRYGAAQTVGCDYCFWTIHFRNRQSFPSQRHPSLAFPTNTDNNLVRAVDSNMVCLFSDRRARCPREVLKVKTSLERRLHKYNMSYSKYSNFPSCDSRDWMTKYWGDNYPRLLAIKARWDPTNVFNHCQSVGSTDNSCCPFTLDKVNGPP